MGNNVRRMFNMFVSKRQDRETAGMFGEWLADADRQEEKEELMSGLWTSTSGNMSWDEVSESLEQTYSRIRNGDSSGRRPASRIRAILRGIVKYSAAAAVFTGAMAFVWHLAVEHSAVAMAEEYVPYGERKEICLPDGSRVHINSETLLLYPDRFTGDSRKVYLVGEASFDVAKDPEHPFVVQAGDMAVTALGTEFNVSSYSDDDMQTATLIEGSVKVECGGADGDVYILSPGEKVSYMKQSRESSVSEADVEADTAWREGLLVFRDVTLDEIFRVLHRNYGIRIILSSDFSNADRYNFRFDEDAELDEVLGIIKAVVGNLEYNMDDGVCSIWQPSRRNCI